MNLQFFWGHKLSSYKMAVSKTSLDIMFMRHYYIKWFRIVYFRHTVVRNIYLYSLVEHLYFYNNKNIYNVMTIHINIYELILFICCVQFLSLYRLKFNNQKIPLVNSTKTLKLWPWKRLQICYVKLDLNSWPPFLKRKIYSHEFLALVIATELQI